MTNNLDILKNDISRNIYNLCLKEGLSRKEISVIRYGNWRPNSVLPKIEELEKAGYIARHKEGKDLVRHTGKCYATRKPFLDFLESHGLFLSSDEGLYVNRIITEKLNFSSFDSDLFRRLLNLIIEDAIITRLFHDVLLKRDDSYRIILPFLEKSHNASTEEIGKLKQQLREKCEKTHNKKPKRHENKAHMRCDVLFSHLLIPDILQLRLQSDLKMNEFQGVFDSIDVIRYVSEDISP